MTACAASLLLLGVGSCKSPTNQPPPTPGIHALSGAGVTDTIGAFLAAPLVFEVRGQDGKPVKGVLVEVVSSLGTVNGAPAPRLGFSALGSDSYASVIAVPTDSTGRASVRVRLGLAAGTAQVTFVAPNVGLVGDASFTVNPGAARTLSVAPLDTAVRVGSSYTLRASAVDRVGNPVAATLTYAALGAAVAVNGASVSGAALGRDSVVVQGAGLTRTAQVSVVPAGTLLAARADGIYTFDLDGSGYRRVVSQTSARSPRWLPDGESFVYSVGLSHAHVSDLDGATRRLVPDSPLDAELWAHPSRDGAWVYFGGYSGDQFRGYPHRVRPNGTGLQLVPGFVEDDFTQGHPSPSPDGGRLAYFREVWNSRNVVIRVLDMATGAVSLDVPGHSPQWSHGDSIAYLNVAGSHTGPIMLMASSGSGQRMVANGQYEFGMDWSPDDRWIVARNAATNRIEVVEVRTGLRIPLPFTATLFDPTWKP